MIKLTPYTVYILVGPSCCGKTTFADSAAAALEKEGYPVQVLSSDYIRRGLLGDHTIDRNDPRMAEVSEQAFNRLFSGLKTAIAFPANVPFVFVDTTGMDSTFRHQIRELAWKSSYRCEVVLFNYKNRLDHLRFAREEFKTPFARRRDAAYSKVLTHIRDKGYDNFLSKALEKHCVSTLAASNAAVEPIFQAERGYLFKQIDRYRTKVLAEVKVRDYDGCIRITKPIDQVQEIEVEKGITWKRLHNNTYDGKIAVIGDSHECPEELRELIAKLEAEGVHQIIHIGDYLDKGGATKEMVELLYERCFYHDDRIIQGNHEAYVARRLRGEIDPNPELEEAYFNSLKVLEGNEGLREKFLEMWAFRSLPFLRFSQEGCRSLYITHAPCKSKHLGKIGTKDIIAQRNFRIEKEEEDIRNAISFIYEEAVGNHPLHVFGHFSHKGSPMVYRNKVFLDTGCVYGNKLTAFVFDGNRYDFVSVPAKKVYCESARLHESLALPPKVDKPFNIRDYDLTPQEEGFVRRFVESGARYISGTMAPAPSWDGKLEPIEGAIEYFKRKGVTHVSVQPKFMGSRAQVYLVKDKPEESFVTSRSGRKVTHIELGPAIIDHHEQFDAWFQRKFPGQTWETAVTDAELMPWHALGKDLIESQFTPYGDLVGEELSTLANDPVFASLNLMDPVELQERQKLLGEFKETLGRFTVEYDPEFCGFNVLLIDGSTEKVAGLKASQKYFNSPKSVLLEDMDLNDVVDVQIIKEFFHTLTVGGGWEGVVIKPEVETEGVIPYMKVRSEDYLTLVYGYDYHLRYDRLVSQKNISGKSSLSLKEHQLGQAMLKAGSEAEITEQVVKMIASMKQEKTLDPRL